MISFSLIFDQSTLSNDIKKNTEDFFDIKFEEKVDQSLNNMAFKENYSLNLYKTNLHFTLYNSNNVVLDVILEQVKKFIEKFYANKKIYFHAHSENISNKNALREAKLVML